MRQKLTVPVTQALFARRREAPAQVAGYRIEPGREYEIRWMPGDDLVGHCNARMTDDQGAVVMELSDLEVAFPIEDVRWRPVFDVGGDGVASLQAFSASGIQPTR